MRNMEFRTLSGIPVKAVYGPEDLSLWDYREKLGNPGEYPFTRGIIPEMYREKLWLMGQYAGFAGSKATNEWYKYLLSQGVTRLIVAEDLPTQIGYDSDHPLAQGEVGRQGVAIDSLADMEAIFDGIPIDKVAINLTGNATGPILLAWMLSLFKKRGLAPEGAQLGFQNDSLKEFFSRGTQIFPPRASVKISCDVVEHCVRNGLKRMRGLLCCVFHIRAAGATYPQAMAFMLADAVAYVEELLRRGLNIDDVAPSLFVFLGATTDLFETVACHRAMRRIWAKMMKERFHANNPNSLALDMTGFGQGNCYTAQQPLNNIVRGTIHTLGTVLGGAQSMMVPSYDEALGLPTAQAARVGLRTQQIVAEESGVASVVDPLAGSYYVEWLTDEVEKMTMEWFHKAEAQGGAIVAIEGGFFEREIAKSSYEEFKRIQSGETVMVGVNKYVIEEPLSIEVRRIDTEEERKQVDSLRKLRKERDNGKVSALLSRLEEAAKEGVNLVPCLEEVVSAYATIGEIVDTLSEVYGRYKPIRL